MALRELSDPPALPLLYARAVTIGLVGATDRLPDIELALPEVAVDREHLAAYEKVCGFRGGEGVSATYPQVLAFPLALRLMTDRAFPLSVLGLVHVANRITQTRPIDPAQKLALRVRAEGLRPHEKGSQFDLVSEARVDGAVVWTGVSTYLRRGDDSASDADAHGDQGEHDGPAGGSEEEVLRIEADVSPRYARVSGDRNPHHLHPLLARVFGFPRLLAHGMWTKARCLAAFEDRLPGALTMDVAFRRPVLLPTTVKLRSAAVDDGWRIALCDPEGGTPHLTGEIRRTAEGGHAR